MTNFTNFADLASHIAAGRGNDAQVETYEGAFLEHDEMAKMTIVDPPEKAEMPDPDQVRVAVEMMMATMFDVLRDTRMEEFARDLAWAASRGIKVIQFRLDRSQGSRAAFVRDDRILGLKPVEAVVCEGSGIQQNLAQKLRHAGVPLHIVRLAHQRIKQGA